MSGHLSSAQLAQVAFLETLPARFERIHRQVEELAELKADAGSMQSLVRLLESLRNEAQALTLGALADNFGLMANLARRTGGGLQMKVRGLREGLVSLQSNYEGALRAATRAGPGGGEGAGTAADRG